MRFIKPMYRVCASNSLLIFILFTSVVLTRGLSRSTGQLVYSTKSTPLRFIRIDEICYKFAIENYPDYFDKWIVEQLKIIHATPTDSFLEDLEKDFEDHQRKIKNYLEQSLKKSKTLSKYAAVFLETETQNLLINIGSIIHDFKKNLLLSLHPYTELSSKIDDFVEAVDITPFSTDSIIKVADVFLNIHRKTAENPEKYSEYQKIIPSLVSQIKSMLKKIIGVYLNSPNEKIYKDLTPEHRLKLEVFYEKFKGLLEGPIVRSTILEFIIGNDRELILNPNFFKDDLFNRLEEMSQVHKPILARDRLVTVDKENPSLEEMHLAAQKYHFSALFPQVFDSNLDDVEFGKSKSEKKQGPDAQSRRSLAKLELMLYKTYILARADNSIPFTEPTGSDNVLRKLFAWVVETDAFDDAVKSTPAMNINLPLDSVDKELVDDNSELIRPELLLIKPEKFKKYFVPLLNLICKKLGQEESCDLFGIHSDKIAKKFKQFEGVILFSATPKLLKLVPSSIVDELKKRAVQLSFDEFISDVQNVASEISSDWSKPLNVKSTPTHSPRVVRMDSIKPIADKFKQKIADKYFGNSSMPDPLKLTYLESFMDTVGSSENNEKKNAMQDMLVDYIVNEIKSGKLDVEKSPLLEKISTILVKKLRTYYNFESLMGLRNLLAYHHFHDQSSAAFPIDSRAPEELPEPARSISVIKHFDLAFFVQQVTLDYLKTLAMKSNNLENRNIFKLHKERLLLFENEMKGKGIDNRVNQYRKSVGTNIYLIEKINSFLFFVNFIDFFEYFETLEFPDAVYTKYQNVYTNFYEFLAILRTKIDKEELEPHTLVYRHLNGCLDHTANFDRAVDSFYDEVCIFSHRKFAEMLFFYKLYVISTNKPGDFDLAPYPSSAFNTHVRTFLSFLKQNPKHLLNFETACQKGNQSICESWKMAKILIDQLFNFNVAGFTFDDPVFMLLNENSFIDKMKLVNAFETLDLVYERGNNKDYSKLIFNRALDINEQSFIFKIEDIDELTNHLKRTYLKLGYSKKELPLSQIVQSILESKDTLKSFLVYNGFTYIDALKIFLLFANTDAHFKTLAKLLIEKQIDPLRLAKLNSPAHDNLMSQLIEIVHALTEKGESSDVLVSSFRNRLNKEYEGLEEKCTEAIVNKISMQSDSNDSLDELGSLIQDLIESDRQNIEGENTVFEKQAVETKRIMETKKIAEVKSVKTLNENFESEIIFTKVEVVEESSRESRKSDTSNSKPLLNGVPIPLTVDVSSIYEHRSDQVHQQLISKLKDLKLDSKTGKLSVHSEPTLVNVDFDSDESIDSIVSDIQNMSRNHRRSDNQKKKRSRPGPKSEQIFL